METAGTQILEESGSKERFIPDGAIQKLLESTLGNDQILGVIYLINKYPLILLGSEEDTNDSQYIIVYYSSVYKYSPITDVDKGKRGFKIKKKHLINE